MKWGLEQLERQFGTVKRIPHDRRYTFQHKGKVAILRASLNEMADDNFFTSYDDIAFTMNINPNGIFEVPK